MSRRHVARAAARERQVIRSVLVWAAGCTDLGFARWVLCEYLLDYTGRPVRVPRSLRSIAGASVVGGAVRS